jgi:hypothetical protein
MSNGIQEAEQVDNTETNTKTPVESHTYLQVLQRSVQPGPVIVVCAGRGKSLLSEFLSKNLDCNIVQINESENGKLVLECVGTKSEHTDSKMTR